MSVAEHKALRGALDDTLAVFKRYIWRPDEWEHHALTLWAAHTHLLDAFDWVPHLLLRSPTGGFAKTRTLLLLRALCHRAVYQEGITEAAALRLCNTKFGDRGGVLLLDQMESGGPSWSRFLDIANRRGARYTQCVQGGKDYEPKEYEIFGPKALAYCNDGEREPIRATALSRCIVLEYRTKNFETDHFPMATCGDDAANTKILPQDVLDASECLRTAASADGAVAAVAAARDHTGLPGGRFTDTWRPLVQLADIAGGPWPKRARACMVAARPAEDDGAPPNVLALRDCVDACDGMPENYVIKSADLVAYLRDLEERPWKDRDLSTNKLARFLRGWGLRPRQDRTKTYRGYIVEKLRKALASIAEAA